MRILMFAALCFGALIAARVSAQAVVVPEEEDEEETRPTASDGGKVEIVPTRSLDENADQLNKLVAAETVDGLVLVVTIDRSSVTLDSATPARVPRRLTGLERKTAGDVVRATAFVGSDSIASTVTPDNVINASEGGGLVRSDRRQVTIVLAADRPIESVEIDAPATGAKARLDVRPAYAQYCKADPAGRWCPQAR